MDRGIVDDANADRIPSAAIGDDLVADGKDAALIVETNFQLVRLVARVSRAHQMLVPILDPAHRPDNPAGKKRDQEILWINMALNAEAAAHIRCRYAHAALRQIENGRRL